MPSVKSYYGRCGASPVTSNPTDAERNCRCLPATGAAAEPALPWSSLMGDPADKEQGRRHRCRTGRGDTGECEAEGKAPGDEGDYIGAPRDATEGK